MSAPSIPHDTRTAMRDRRIRTTSPFTVGQKAAMDDAADTLEQAWRQLHALRDTTRPSSTAYQFFADVMARIAEAELSIRTAIATRPAP